MAVSDIERIGARVAWLIGARGDDYNFEVNDDRFDRNEIAQAIVETEAELVSDMAEAAHPERESLLNWIPSTRLASGDTIPAHVGQIEAVRIIPYVPANQPEGIDPTNWELGESTTRNNIRAWRDNHNNVFDALDHTQEGSNLTPYFNQTNDTLEFTGISAQVKAIDYTPDYPSLANPVAATGSLNFEQGTAASGTLTFQIAAGTYATGYLLVTPATAYATGSITIRQGVAASGVLTFVGTPNNNETIAVNGVTFTFKTVPTGPFDVERTLNATRNAQALAAAINLNAGTGGLTHAVASALGNKTIITYDTLGLAGNVFTLANSSSSNITRGAATLLGGVDGITDGEVLYVNGISVNWYDPGNPPIILSGPDFVSIAIDDDAGTNAINLAATLNASALAPLSSATYTATHNVVDISYDIIGAFGNSYGLADSSFGAITASGSSLTGGVGGVKEGETIVINGVTFTFSNYNAGTNPMPYDPTDMEATAALIAATLNASSNGSINVATYTPVIPPDAIITDEAPDLLTAVRITYDTTGSGGNAYTLANSSSSGVTYFGAVAHLTGGISGVANNETLVINGHTITWKTSGAVGQQINIDPSPTVNATNLAAYLNASTDPLLTVADYAPSANVVTINYQNTGTGGNAFTIANSSADAIVASGTTLSGGTGHNGPVDGETIVINGRTFTFKISPSTAYHIDISDYTIVPQAMLETLNALSADSFINVATYELNTGLTGINIIYATAGTIGNAYTIANSSNAAVVASGSTLTGGLDGLDDPGSLQIPDVFESGLVFGAITKLSKIGVPSALLNHAIGQYNQTRSMIRQGLTYQPDIAQAQAIAK